MIAGMNLFLNPSKSELVNLGLDEMVFLCKTQCINSILENLSFGRKEDVILLGSPLTSTAIQPQFQHKLFIAMTEKLSLLDTYPCCFLAGNRLILSLTSLVNTFLNGQISDFARILFFQPISMPLGKKMEASAQ